jgi:hypothetical protein
MAEPSTEAVVSQLRGAGRMREVQLVDGSNKVYVGTDFNIDLSGVAASATSYDWPGAAPVLANAPLVSAVNGAMGWSPYASTAKKVALYSTDTTRVRFQTAPNALTSTQPGLVARFTFDPTVIASSVTYHMAASLSIPNWDGGYVGNIYVALRKIENVDATTDVSDTAFDLVPDLAGASIVIPHTTAPTSLSLRQYANVGESAADPAGGVTTYAVVVYANPPNEVTGLGNRMDVQDITVTITDSA